MNQGALKSQTDKIWKLPIFRKLIFGNFPNLRDYVLGTSQNHEHLRLANRQDWKLWGWGRKDSKCETIGGYSSLLRSLNLGPRLHNALLSKGLGLFHFIWNSLTWVSETGCTKNRYMTSETWTMSIYISLSRPHFYNLFISLHSSRSCCLRGMLSSMTNSQLVWCVLARIVRF